MVKIIITLTFAAVVLLGIIVLQIYTRITIKRKIKEIEKRLIEQKEADDGKQE